MKLAIISDLHLTVNDKYMPQFDLRNKEGAEILIIAGDLITAQTGKMLDFAKDIIARAADEYSAVFYVPGNHEFYTTGIKNGTETLKDALTHPFGNVYFLNRKLIYVQGIKFVGATLWTNIDRLTRHPGDYVNDFRYIDEFKEDHRLYQAEHEKDLAFLKQHVTGSTVVITHHTPTFKSGHPKWAHTGEANRLFHNDLDDFIEERNPLAWIHGHTHDPIDYMLNDTRIICHPRGYQNEGGRFFYEPKILEVDLRC